MENRTSQYRRGVLLLIPLLLIVVILSLLARPKAYDTYHYEPKQEEPCDTLITEEATPPALHAFDPNTAQYLEMVKMGIERRVAVAMIRWREAGKVYRIKEDVALCYNMTDSMYRVLEPYINIGEHYRIKPAEHTEFKRDTVQRHYTYTPFRIDTATVTYLHSIGFSARQASLIIRYRDMIGGYRNFAEFAECYAVDSTKAAELKPYIIFPPEEPIARNNFSETKIVDINSADSATLVRLPGIGAKSAQAIIRYRELLGGYHDISQIRELEVVTEENFCKFSQQISCDSAVIEKIYINFARPKELEVHPYLSNRMLRRIINHRELKGGWSTIEEMIDSKIFNEEEAARIAPYLDFGTPDREPQQPTE